jgi:hypothetical protein
MRERLGRSQRAPVARAPRWHGLAAPPAHANAMLLSASSPPNSPQKASACQYGKQPISARGMSYGVRVGRCNLAFSSTAATLWVRL